MRRKPKADRCAIKSKLERGGVDFTDDFHALRRSQVDALVDAARAAGYRKRKDAPGSRARMFFQHLARKACR